MSIPSDFQFSQASLQDFVTCPRRFELRYLQRLNWPGIQSEPIQEAERLAQLGTDFHRLVHQHKVGVDEDILTGSLAQSENELKSWWHNYLDNHSSIITANSQTYPEITLSSPLRDYQLMARFDLLAVQANGTFLIVDWKTAQHKPKREWLERRIQTRVYLYLLTTAGASFNGGRLIEPSTVKMLYWYPHTPEQPELFDYNDRLYQRDKQFLSSLIEQIKDAARRENFPLVELDDKKPCRYCRYRSFCDRGDKAGLLTADIEEELTDDMLSLDWGQIAELQF